MCEECGTRYDLVREVPLLASPLKGDKVVCQACRSVLQAPLPSSPTFARLLDSD